MSWIFGAGVAIIGGLTGGSLTLTAGALNDARTARREQRARIRALSAVVLSTSGKMADTVMQAQVQRMEDPDGQGLDWATIHGYELTYTTAYAELSWLIGRSPLFPLLVHLESARSEVVRRWGADHPAWIEYYAAVHAAREKFDGAVQYFGRLTAGQARDYVESDTMPAPPPLGARPSNLKRGFGRSNFP